MDKNDWGYRENMSEIRKFGRRHIWEVLSTIAIIVAGISAWGHFFYGNINWSIWTLAAGAIATIFYPWRIDSLLKRTYTWKIGKSRSWGLILEGIKIAIALFVPYIYFAWIGMMAGSSIHYYIRHAHSTEDKGSKAA